MENTKNNIKDIILSASITAIMTFIFTVILQFIVADSGKITFNNSIRVDNSYLTSVEVRNFKTKDYINDIEISLNSLKINKIEYNENLEIKYDNSKLILNKVLPKSSSSIIIYTDKPIESNEVFIVTKDNLNIVYTKNEKSVIYIIFVTVGINTIVFFIMLVFINAYHDKKNIQINQRIEVIRDRNEAMGKECDELKNQSDLSYDRLKQVEKTNYENRLYYVAKINDFSKELDFWRNTVRNLLYKSGIKKIDVDDINNEITNSLKTYGTKDKMEISHEELSFFARKLKNYDK